MVKPFFLFLLLLPAACSTEPAVDAEAFETSRFRLENYAEQVQAFLAERPETAQKTGYRALFVNTKDCSACARASFEQMKPFLQRTRATTFIYINDSTLINEVKENPKVHFVCLPKTAFEERGIFHGTIYLYIAGKQLRALEMNAHRIDSVNATR